MLARWKIVSNGERSNSSIFRTSIGRRVSRGWGGRWLPNHCVSRTVTGCDAINGLSGGAHPRRTRGRLPVGMEHAGERAADDLPADGPHVRPRLPAGAVQQHHQGGGGQRRRARDLQRRRQFQTAEIHFDGNHLTNHIPVQFTVDRWNGTAGALDLDVQAEAMRFFQKIDATMTPATPQESPMHLVAQEGNVPAERERRRLQRARRPHPRLRPRRVGQGRRPLRRRPQEVAAVARRVGHVLIEMGANSSAVSAGANLADARPSPATATGASWDRDGQITAINAVGDTAVAHAVIDGPPKRDIVCAASSARASPTKWSPS